MKQKARAVIEAHTAFNQALAGSTKPVKDNAPTGGLDTMGLLDDRSAAYMPLRCALVAYFVSFGLGVLLGFIVWGSSL